MPNIDLTFFKDSIKKWSKEIYSELKEKIKTSKKKGKRIVIKKTNKISDTKSLLDAYLRRQNNVYSQTDLNDKKIKKSTGQSMVSFDVPYCRIVDKVPITTTGVQSAVASGIKNNSNNGNFFQDSEMMKNATVPEYVQHEDKIQKKSLEASHTDSNISTKYSSNSVQNDDLSGC